MKKSLFKILFFIAALLLSTKAQAQAIPSDLAASVPAFGEESPAAAAFLEKASRKGASRDFTVKVLEEGKRLRERGLPAEPYFLKASEGLAKGAPPARIGGALENTRKQTEQAETLVNRAIQRRDLASSPAGKREAVLNFQRALSLNQTPPRRLEKLIDEQDASGKPSLEKLGKAAREISKTKAVFSPSDRGTPSLEEGKEKQKDFFESKKKEESEKRPDKSKGSEFKSDKKEKKNSSFEEKEERFKKSKESSDRSPRSSEGSSSQEKEERSFKKSNDSSNQSFSPSPRSSGGGHGKNK